MGKVVNLRTFKKQKARSEKSATTAQAAREQAGAAKADKERLKAMLRLENERLNGHERDRSDET